MGFNDKKRLKKAKRQKVRNEKFRQSKVKRVDTRQSPPFMNEDISHVSNTLEFSQNFRETCSECNSLNITWSTLGHLANKGSTRIQGAAKELLPILGVSAHAWACSDCGGLGAFDQSIERS